MSIKVDNYSVVKEATGTDLPEAAAPGQRIQGTGADLRGGAGCRGGRGSIGNLLWGVSSSVFLCHVGAADLVPPAVLRECACGGCVAGMRALDPHCHCGGADLG